MGELIHAVVEIIIVIVVGTEAGINMIINMAIGMTVGMTLGITTATAAMIIIPETMTAMVHPQTIILLLIALNLRY